MDPTIAQCRGQCVLQCGVKGGKGNIISYCMLTPTSLQAVFEYQLTEGVAIQNKGHCMEKNLSWALKGTVQRDFQP